ncbi:MAG: SpoIIE family protein phosphatase [Flavobacteriales bacterium]|nr:SpoIIE family protein phosphatase [Flavobacteriales bacterium]
MRKWVCICFMCFLSFSFYGNEYGKAFYLVDSLDLSLLHKNELSFLDSCLDLYHKQSSDTAKFAIIRHIVEESWNANVWPKYNIWLLHKVEKKLTETSNHQVQNVLKGYKADCLSDAAYELNQLKGDKVKAIAHLQKSIVLNSEIGNKRQLANNRMNMGVMLPFVGDVEKAIFNFSEALRLFESINDSIGMANTLNNMGRLMLVENLDLEAVKYFKRAEEICTASENYKTLGLVKSSLAQLSVRAGQIDSAIIYLLSAENMFKSINAERNLARCYFDLGEIYLNEKKYELSKVHLNKSLDLFLRLAISKGMLKTYILLAEIEIQMGDLREAKSLIDKAENITKTYSDISSTIRLLDVKVEWYQKRNKYKKALQTLMELKTLEDSSKTMLNEQLVWEHQAQVNYEKQQAEVEKDFAIELAKKEAEKSKQKIIIFVSVLGLLSAVGFLVFVFNRLRITRIQKRQIESYSNKLKTMHNKLSIQHDEIQDSIQYAERIQKAIMPPEKDMLVKLMDAFILYKPKDIVAGDFYWMESKVIEDTIYFAAADCTGHGVPGAMVSMVCASALSKALVEEGIYETGPLLDRTREIVIKRLEKGGQEVRDGMDISLCKLNRKTKELEWSGANNPLWIIRNNMVFEEFKGDKQPIGLYTDPFPFTTHTIKLDDKDCIYILSDGYQDQFGGPKNKKYKSKRLKSFLLEIHQKSMEEQKNALTTELQEWMEDTEQVDDICIIGLRI